MSDIKTVNLTGGAATDFTGGVKKKKRVTRKKQEGGDAKGIEAPATQAGGPTDPSKWLSYPSASVPPVIQVQKAMIPSPSQVAAPSQQYTVPIPSQSAMQQTGGVKHIKVELKKKPATKKVQLHPKKSEPSKVPKRVTRKSRRLTLGVSSLHKRMTRAKKMHKTVKEMPLDKLKEELVKKKLIKPTSKAPESVLRQIAADAQIVAGKAL